MIPSLAQLAEVLDLPVVGAPDDVPRHRRAWWVGAELCNEHSGERVTRVLELRSRGAVLVLSVLDLDAGRRTLAAEGRPRALASQVWYLVRYPERLVTWLQGT